MISKYNMRTRIDMIMNHREIRQFLSDYDIKCLEEASRYIEMSVSLGTYAQCSWERDVAIDQLRKLGYSLGEKPRTDDRISRTAAIKAFTSKYDSILSLANVIETFEEIPSVDPIEEGE